MRTLSILLVGLLMLSLWQYLVPVLRRRQRRLLPRGADAMRPWAPSVARSVLALLLLAGCAQTTVSQQQSYEGSRLARPNRIIVHDFAASASDLPAGYAIAVAAPPHASQTTDDVSLGRKLGAEVARNLVSELQG